LIGKKPAPLGTSPDRRSATGPGTWQSPRGDHHSSPGRLPGRNGVRSACL